MENREAQIHFATNVFLNILAHALVVSSVWKPQMSLVERTPTQDELLSHETQSEAPAEDDWAVTAHLDDDSDPLSAPRGVMWGVLVGSIVWAVILWVLL